MSRLHPPPPDRTRPPHSPALAPSTRLTTDHWLQLSADHRIRAMRHTAPARERRDRGIPHPVADFLFTYYPFPFSLLERWHPGVGIALQWDPQQAPPPPFNDPAYQSGAGVIFADPSRMQPKEFQRLQWMSELLEATRDRPPFFACHGLHEWAMVYQGQQIRHEKTLPLRLSRQDIDALVESRPIRCSHHDAFRFFAAAARPLNQLQPTLESRTLLEQPGCLHANMDLYKWTAKAMPWAGSALLLDCFELAVDLRCLDMRASPYDVSGYGLAPVPIETTDGRRTYEQEQRTLAARAVPLRERLIEAIHATLALAGRTRR